MLEPFTDWNSLTFPWHDKLGLSRQKTKGNGMIRHWWFNNKINRTFLHGHLEMSNSFLRFKSMVAITCKNIFQHSKTIFFSPMLHEQNVLPDLLKDLGQCSQAKGRCSEWVTMCRPSLLEVAKVFGQWGHLCGFSPVWM